MHGRGARRSWRIGVVVVLTLMVRCGPDAAVPPPLPGDGGALPLQPAMRPPLPEPPLVFQPAFALALRESESLPSPTTLRMQVPLERGGIRVRVVFRAGDAGMALERAFVATTRHPAPVALGLPEGAAQVAPGARVRSLPVALAVERGEVLTVTFELRGSVATSALAHLPGGEQRSGRVADASAALGGVPRERAAGVVAVEVEGPRTAALVAVGDSITEGYVSGQDDIRRAWPHLAAVQLKLPIANAGVSGQGVRLAAQHLDEEVLSLANLTDCILFLGTNDLHAFTAEDLTAELALLLDRMRPHCRVWAATLLPKERTSQGELEEVQQRRSEVNAWLRTGAQVEGVLDFEAAVRGVDAHHFAHGLGEDGIHPSVRGQRTLGTAAARFFSERLLPPP